MRACMHVCVAKSVTVELRCHATALIKIGTPEIVKNRFSQKRKVILNFLKKNAIFEIF